MYAIKNVFKNKKNKHNYYCPQKSDLLKYIVIYVGHSKTNAAQSYYVGSMAVELNRIESSYQYS